jgi:hypothetical protein
VTTVPRAALAAVQALVLVGQLAGGHPVEGADALLDPGIAARRRRG